MAEGVLFNIAQGIIERLGSHAFEKIGLVWGVKDELRKLKEKVAQLQAVLLDAEQKQANNNEVKVWLESVEDAVYEADDVLDEFDTQVQQRQMVSGNNSVSKQVCIFFSTSNQLFFGLKMGHKIKDFNKRLHEIALNRTFGQLERNREDVEFVRRERVTHSFVREDNIIGRDEDKRAIIQLLLDLDPISTENTENVSTISIVGFGGMGKTALAQLVFNDEEVQKHFEPKMWTCVSNSFQLDILVKKILKTDNLDMDQLQNELRKKIDGKRYLLVLDDVWNDNREKWLSLKDLLMGGARGSKILITTRIETVAKITNTAKPYKLKGLNEEQSWSLFTKMAFQDGKEPTSSTIKAIGEEIATKCKGVPLAIRTIGRMLYTRDPETEWSAFKNNKLSTIRHEENDILPTLKLSYDVLPSHLKHCFAYCSLFPPDYKIPVEILIKLWVAQGFVKSSNPNECLEDAGYEYYNELVWRSFFQEEEKDKFGIIKSCKMHDLMNELAVKVAGKGSRIMDGNQTDFDAKRLHVSFDFDVDLSEWKIPTSLLESNKLRTFLFLSQNPWVEKKSFHKSFCATIASNFKSLRMLSLNKLGITKLPKCLRKMKHLRYLDLSENPIERLPNWIVKLQNLETLDLTRCYPLVELPRDIKKLINLRHLILEGCVNLDRIPRGLGELTWLHTLSRFVLSKNNSMLRDNVGLNELGKLKDLRGKLKIINLRYKKDMVSELNYDGAVLKEKRRLYSLSLHWIRIEGENSDAVEKESDVIIKSMEALQPHSSLKKLVVQGYRGARFASWFHSLTNIVNLKLSHCDRCQHLPPLDHLPLLKSLKLFGLRNLEHISKDMVKDFASDEMMMMSAASPSTTFFPSLENLWLGNCPNLKGWWRNETASASASSFPCLSTLSIWDCPNLTSMPLYPNLDELWLQRSSWKVLPSSFVPSSKLKYLRINGIKDIEYVPEEGIGNLTLLEELEIKDCPNLASLPDQGMGRLISLQRLHISNCPKLASLPERIGNLTLLQHLQISDFPNLASLPEWIGNLTLLQHLHISNFPNLASLPEWIGNLTLLQHLHISKCPNLASLPERIGNLTLLQSLHISNFPNLAYLPEWIGNLTLLQHLEIRDCPKLASLPEGIGNLKSLSNLRIRCLPNLASLPEGLRCLISLQDLKFWDCPKLASLPEGMGNLKSLQLLLISDCPNLASLPEGLRCLASLKSLYIWKCPILEQRCQKETGEDWSKIAHIPDIRIHPKPASYYDF